MPASPHYPELSIQQRLSGSHLQTFIILHGRGSNARIFGSKVLATPIPDFDDLPCAFQHATFIFPNASRHRARIYQRTPIYQWFGHWSHEAPEEREELQNDGLQEKTVYIDGLLREVDAVGAENVVLGGLSQAWSASLVALLLWEGGRCGGRWVCVGGRLIGRESIS
jgi:predicted esterase